MNKLVFGVIAFIAVSLGCTSASNRKVSSDSYYEYKDGKRYYCESTDDDNNGGHNGNHGHHGDDSDDNIPITCIPHCTDGYWDSAGKQCRGFGADFCGKNPYCNKQCTDGYYDSAGTQCRGFGPDVCYENK